MRNATKLPRNHVLEFRFFASVKFLCTTSYATLFPVSPAHNGCNLSISSGASACLLQTAVLLLVRVHVSCKLRCCSYHQNIHIGWNWILNLVKTTHKHAHSRPSDVVSISAGRASRCRGFLCHGQGEELAANWLFTFIRGK